MLARHSKGRWGKFPVVWNKQYVLSGEGRDCAALGTERGLSGCRERGQHGGGGGEGASSLSPGGLWGSWSDSPVSQVNAFTLHPESDRKPLKGFEQGLTQSYLRFRKVTSGSAEGTAGCGGAARGGGWEGGRAADVGCNAEAPTGRCQDDTGFLAVEVGGCRSHTLGQGSLEVVGVAEEEGHWRSGTG